MNKPIDRGSKTKPKVTAKQVFCEQCHGPATRLPDICLYICANCEAPDADTPQHMTRCIHCDSSLEDEFNLRKVVFPLRQCKQCNVAWVRGDSYRASMTQPDWEDRLVERLPALHERRREEERIAARNKARLARRDLECEPTCYQDLLDNDELWQILE